MSQRSRREYLERIRDRYGRAGRRYKSRILDEFCEVCGYNRKHAIKLLRGQVRPPRRRRRRQRLYGRVERQVVAAIWWKAQQPCSQRLKAVLPLWLPFYERRYGTLSERRRQKVLAISASTLDRMLAPIRARARRQRQGGTRPGRLVRTQIPIRAGQWKIDGPGYLEADTVAHCGESMSGSFAWSITFTDIHTGWTEVRAVWNRGAVDVVRRVREVEQHLPFPLKGFDCDNGGEFLNWHLFRYFQQRPRGVAFTRSRPYHKDDNAHVEQKNWTHVREWLGYERFDVPAVVPALNDLYGNEWSAYHNFFRPAVKLLSKQRVKSRLVKHHDAPQTPYQRLLAWPGLSAEKRAELLALYEPLDPFALVETIELKLRAIFRLLRASTQHKAA